MTTTTPGTKTTINYGLTNPSMLVLVPLGMLFVTVGNLTPVASKQMTLLLIGGTISILGGTALRFIIGIARATRMAKRPDFDVNEYKSARDARKQAHKDWAAAHPGVVGYFRWQIAVVFALYAVIIFGSNSSSPNQHTAAAAAGALWLALFIAQRVISKVTKRPRY